MVEFDSTEGMVAMDDFSGMVKFDGTEGMVAFDDCIGMVEFDGTDGMIAMDDCIGMIEIDGTDGLVATNDCSGMVEFDDSCISGNVDMDDFGEMAVNNDIGGISDGRDEFVDNTNGDVWREILDDDENIRCFVDTMTYVCRVADSAENTKLVLSLLYLFTCNPSPQLVLSR